MSRNDQRLCFPILLWKRTGFPFLKAVDHFVDNTLKLLIMQISLPRVNLPDCFGASIWYNIFLKTSFTTEKIVPLALYVI